MTDKECFIIMPITTPNEFISKYRDDHEHFLHVMECLFKPAIEKAGFKPITPIIQGSEIIHGDIISNIESSDLVLCDMSILNPNVFFELGIRTALNKPVCLIKDTVVEKVPFDTNIINYHTYSPDLSSWIVKNEIEKLTRHIIESFTKSSNCNSLWKYFSLKSIATPPEKLNGDAEKIEYLTVQVDAMRKQLNESVEATLFETPRKISYKFLGEGLPRDTKIRYVINGISDLFTKYGINPTMLYGEQVPDLEGTRLKIYYKLNKDSREISNDVMMEIMHFTMNYGIKVDLIKIYE